MQIMISMISRPWQTSVQTKQEPCEVLSAWFEVKDLQAQFQTHKKAPYIFLVLKELETSLRMGIYEDWQIHTKTGFRPIKLQESQSAPHTNRTPSNKWTYEIIVDIIQI